MTSTIPSPTRVRRRHPLLKALGGVVALLLVAFIAGAAGLRVVQDMINENGKSRIELFADGTDRATVVTIGDKQARMTVALPSTPLPGHEDMTLFGVVRAVDRSIATAGDDGSVQVLWFRIVPELARNPEATMRTLASAQASNLGGEPLDGKVVSTGTTAQYDFRVHPTGSISGGNDYAVRILMRGNVVYVVRVEADKGAPEALKKVVESIRWV